MTWNVAFWMGVCMQTHIESLDRRTHPFALPHTPTLSPAHTAPAHALILSVGCGGGVARQGASPGRLLAAAAATIDTTTTGSSDSSTTTAAVAPRFISLSPRPMHHTHQPFFVVVSPPRAGIPPPPERTPTKTCVCTPARGPVGSAGARQGTGAGHRPGRGAASATHYKRTQHAAPRVGQAAAGPHASNHTR